MDLDLDTAVVTPASELQYDRLRDCCAPGCDAKARWTLMEKTPRRNPVTYRRCAGAIGLYCDQHISDAEVADEELVAATARYSPEMELYRNLAAAWPNPARLL